jgi:hypothetical protein
VERNQTGVVSRELALAVGRSARRIVGERDATVLVRGDATEAQAKQLLEV